MFQSSQFAGGGSGTAALSLDSALRPVGRRAATPARPFSLVVDLGDRIGSPEWLRGFATLGVLCYAACSFAPAIGPIAGNVPAPLNDAHWEESRALSIAPLALGADTGRRMAPTEAVVPLPETPERPRIDLTGTLGSGDSFARMLERSGVASAQAAEVAALVGSAIPLTDLKPGTAVDIALGRRPNKSVPRPLDALALRARFDLKVEIARVDGQLKLNAIPIAVDHTPLRIQGSIGASLYRAARAAGAPAKSVEAYIRAISSQLPIERLGSDDKFDLIIEHRRAETGETETGKLLFAGLNRASGKNLQLMQWDIAGRTDWFEATGVGKSRGMLQRPVPGNVSSNFGMRRHPILGYSRMHKGMDFRAGYGTPILAAADATVSGAGRAGGYGNQVRLTHAGGLTTSYSHMSRIAVSRGSRVKQGQVIGYVGSTGLSTGPHLHYELYRNGVAVNPASVKFVMRPTLGGADLARFKSELNRLLAVKPGAALEAPEKVVTAEAAAAKPTA